MHADGEDSIYADADISLLRNEPHITSLCFWQSADEWILSPLYLSLRTSRGMYVPDVDGGRVERGNS
jgi:hypothetical protein